MIGALAHGVPMVLLPIGADQPANAERCAALGVARVLDPVGCSPEAVREATRAVLADPAYRSAAERMAQEIAAMPDPAEAVPLLERLPPGPRNCRKSAIAVEAAGLGSGGAGGANAEAMDPGARRAYGALGGPHGRDRVGAAAGRV
ncbi:glycosyltransferase [Inquilinus sp. OTU3971]|uniref:glycosyltransferase n=1 Tax=Inquilinus sp. OTU3971 TaxID=3043855 RepID=UPI00313E6BC9